MKKVWRCSLCKQICSRRENLKRHFKRLHNGQGIPILQYLSGNSILTPDETSPTLMVFPDEYATRLRTKAPVLQPYLTHIQNRYGWEDRLFKLIQLQSSINQSRFQNQPPFLSQNHKPVQNSYRSINLTYVGNETTSNKPYNIPKNYYGISGFKADICLSCLTTLSMPIGSRDLNLQEFHKCIPGTEDVIEILGPEEYAHDLRRKVNNFPELLFNECKEWANSTASGQIYLTARKIEESDKSETQNDNTLIDYDALPFLNKVLEQSKMTLNDDELYEFLKFTINQTKTIITLRGQPGQANLKYMLEVSPVR